MDIHANHTDLFDQYLRGSLGEEEKRSFEKQLKEDAVFAEMFRIHTILVLGIQDSGRAELKEYLATATASHTEAPRMNVYRRYFAIAASVVLAVGMYFVFKNFSDNGQKAELAVQTNTKEMLMDSAPAVTLNQRSKVGEGILSVEHEKESVHVDKWADIPDEEIIAYDDIAPPGSIVQGIEPAMEEETKLSEKSSGKYLKDEVLSEIKLKDTIVSALVLYMETIQVKTTAVASSNKQNEYFKKSSQRKLPANANNQATSNDSKNNTIDTVAALPSVSKEKADLDTKTYPVEYWLSPVNFKGYRFTGNTIRLYGIPVQSASIFVYASHVYMRYKGDVYMLSECSNGCAFIAETDTAITQLILKQN